MLYYLNVRFYTELFNVYLLPTSLLNFSGECLLQVTANQLSLLDVQHPHAVRALWPLSTIRQYGHPKDENFTFIAGRYKWRCHLPGLQGDPQNLAPFFLYPLTLPSINRFWKLFHCQNQEKICNNAVAKDPTTHQVCRYTILWNVSVIKATIENKTTSVDCSNTF